MYYSSVLHVSLFVRRIMSNARLSFFLYNTEMQQRIFKCPKYIPIKSIFYIEKSMSSLRLTLIDQ